MDKKTHWEDIYVTKKSDEVSWYQTSPKLSLQMIRAAGLNPADPIIDVGGGVSGLVDHLVDLGYEDLTVLDISQEALGRTRQRLGGLEKKIDWIASDVTAFKPGRQYRFWHDRAVFHFLTDLEERKRYLQVMSRAVVGGGYVMIATFALDGPDKCSGLPVQRYSHESLQETLGPIAPLGLQGPNALPLGSGFEMILKDREVHTTPWETTQSFIYALFRKS